MQSKYLCLDLRTCALLCALVDALSTILVYIAVGLILAVAKLVVTAILLYGILARKPPFLLPFLVANCLLIIMAFVGIVSKFVIASDTSYDVDIDESIDFVKKDDPMKRHKTLYTIVAICFILSTCHAWLVIFALWKQDSSAENKIVDSGIVGPIPNYPRLQSVDTTLQVVDSVEQPSSRNVDDEMRFTYN